MIPAKRPTIEIRLDEVVAQCDFCLRDGVLCVSAPFRDVDICKECLEAITE